jgi:hypothetical protein
LSIGNSREFPIIPPNIYSEIPPIQAGSEINGYDVKVLFRDLNDKNQNPEKIKKYDESTKIRKHETESLRCCLLISDALLPFTVHHLLITAFFGAFGFHLTFEIWHLTLRAQYFLMAAPF